MISYLQVDNLSKRFGEQLLFENISFGIGKGQKVALIAKTEWVNPRFCGLLPEKIPRRAGR